MTENISVEKKKEIVENKKMTRQELAKKLERERAKDHELISVLFRNLEQKGGEINFRFKKYPGDQYDHYCYRDGERYKMPRMIIRHLNNEVHYWEYTELQGNLGPDVKAAKQRGVYTLNDGRVTNQDMNVKRKLPRCEVVILEYVEDHNDLMPSQLVTAQYR